VFDWPANGELYLPGLKTKITSAKLLRSDKSEAIPHKQRQGWTCLTLPPRAADPLVSVIEITLAGKPEVDKTLGIDPLIPSELNCHFATVENATKNGRRWMEKFGEWKHAEEVSKWQAGGTATWEVDVLKPGNYQVELTYAGEGRLVWGVSVDGKESIQNQQNSSQNYQTFPIGWMEFSKLGRHRVSVSCLEGNIETASLKAINFTPVSSYPAETNEDNVSMGEKTAQAGRTTVLNKLQTRD
jgi:alpha-L-fucosidase